MEESEMAVSAIEADEATVEAMVTEHRVRVIIQRCMGISTIPPTSGI